MDRIYFDWAASSPPLYTHNTPQYTGNPSSLHREGKKARAWLEESRERCAAVMGVDAGTLHFCSGGTEANLLVLHSLLARNTGPGLLYSAVEHPSIRMNVQTLTRLGIDCRQVQTGTDGRVSSDMLRNAVEKQPGARMICIMSVNNETGAVNDIGTLAAHSSRAKAALHLHCDAVQALGKIPFDTGLVDSASFSAHKIGGPKGIGLLYLKKPIEALGRGGHQEKGIRPGTENMAGAAAFAECMERFCTPHSIQKEHAAATERMALIIHELKKNRRCRILPEEREEKDGRFSPYILQASFDGIPGEVMLRSLDDAGIAVSTGSACSAGEKKRPVLSAMGISDAIAFNAVRLSQGYTSSMEDAEKLIQCIKQMLRQL